jgi:hypothetical protein
VSLIQFKDTAVSQPDHADPSITYRNDYVEKIVKERNEAIDAIREFVKKVYNVLGGSLREEIESVPHIKRLLDIAKQNP